jgi:hypothetical protein
VNEQRIPSSGRQLLNVSVTGNTVLFFASPQERDNYGFAFHAGSSVGDYKSGQTN